MKFLVILTITCVVAFAFVNADEIDWSKIDNPQQNPEPAVSTGSSSGSSAGSSTGSSSGSKCTSSAKQKCIEDGKKVYQKYIAGGYIDDEGLPDYDKAPSALKKETTTWADEVENVDCDLDEITEEVSKAF